MIPQIQELIEKINRKYAPLNREVVATIDDSYIDCFKVGRMTGNTTRMIDKAIQDLFTGKIVICFEDVHRADTATRRYFYDKLLGRLYSEHLHHFKHSLVKDKALLVLYLKHI